MTAVLTITGTDIPDFTGLTYDLPEIPTPGIVGGLLAKLLEGKDVGASLTIAENPEGGLTETLTVDTNVPFVSNLFKGITESQAIPALVATVIKELAPQGISLAAKISLSA